MTLAVVLLGLVIFGAPISPGAQPASKVHRIGLLSVLSPGPVADPFLDQFRQGLREFGPREGENLLIEYRWAEGNQARLPALAADLVRLRVDLIVADTSSAALPARQATSTIPIVMHAVGDPVSLGLVASLARPGGNVTGTTSFGPALSAKQLQLLRDVVPGMKRVAIMGNPANPLLALWHKNLQEAAGALGLGLQILPIARPDDFEPAFRTAVRERAAAVIVGGDAMLS